MRYSLPSMRRQNNALLNARNRVSRASGHAALLCALALGFGVIPQAASALDINVRGGVHDDFNRLVFDWPQAPKYTLTRSEGGLVKLVFKGAATGFVLTPSVRKLSRIAGFDVTPQADGTLVQFRVAPAAVIKDFLSGTAVVIDVTGAVPEPGSGPVSLPGEAKRTADDQPAAAAAAAVPADPVAATAQNPVPVMTAAPAAGLPAVLFERAAQSYALLESRGRAIATLPDIAPLETVTGWRRPLQDGAVLTVSMGEGKGKAQIAAAAVAENSGMPLTITAQPDYAAGGRVLVGVAAAGSVLSFIDPVVGDTLYAVPTLPGQFVANARHYAAFDLLPTRQGVVVRPLNDKLTVKLSPDGLELSMPGGLKLSPAAATGSRTIQDAAAPKLPALEAPTVSDDVADTGKPAAAEPSAAQIAAGTAPDWFLDVAGAQAKQGETFTMARQRLQNAIAGVGTDDPNLRAQARLNLVRFYLANAYGQEADGLLADIAADTPDLTSKPAYRALRGIARALTNDADAALEDLGLPELAGYPDLALWRAFANARARDFAKASPLFASSLDTLALYPEPFFTRFARLAGESFLATNENDNAKRVILLLRQRGGDAALARPPIVYIRGVIESRVGSLDAAKKLWEQVADTNDMLTRTRANMALVDLGVASKTIAPVDAAKMLERLRFGWRGDSLELDLLQRLATAYAGAGQLDEALGALEKAKRIAPSRANTEMIETQQRQIFSDLFMSKAIDDYPPLKTLATYNRYKQFAPLDAAKATAVNNRLVDKMLKIDLLGQAADLLDQQVPATADAAARGRLGARIAGIRILNLEPAAALKTLEATEAPKESGGLPVDLMEERRLLRSRALADSGQVQPALKLLEGDSSDDARRLVATIAWRAKDWPAAASALVGLIPAPGTLQGAQKDSGKLAPEQAQLVVRRAVALTLAGDTAALSQLNGDYGAAMKETPSAASFALLTAPEGAIKALAALPGEMKDVDLFKNFLESYRK